MPENYRKYLDPEVLQSIARLDLKARLIVEGFVSGLHRSPFHGFSVEFAEHREYVPGDDIRHVDWKVYGKSDRFYIKQYEEETNLRAWLFVDISESMEYGHAPWSKIEYARTGAAALANLIVRQRDSVGLCLFDESARAVLNPASSLGHLDVLIRTLAETKTAGKTSLENVVRITREQIGGRGIVIIFSDLLDNADSILAAVRQLRHHNHEVVLFHVLDHEERTFPFERTTLFEGLESAGDVVADPAALRTAYLKELADFTKTIRRNCEGDRVDFVEVDTKTRLDVVLSRYLASRGHRR